MDHSDLEHEDRRAAGLPTTAGEGARRPGDSEPIATPGEAAPTPADDEPSGTPARSRWVVDFDSLERWRLQGFEHRSIVSVRDGFDRLEVWERRVAPGSALPVQRFALDQVVIVTAGHGELIADGVVEPFAAPCALRLPAHAIHQLVNTGERPLCLVVAFAGSPVRTLTFTGTPVAQPWEIEAAPADDSAGSREESR